MIEAARGASTARRGHHPVAIAEHAELHPTHHAQERADVILVDRHRKPEGLDVGKQLGRVQRLCGEPVEVLRLPVPQVERERRTSSEVRAPARRRSTARTEHRLLLRGQRPQVNAGLTHRFSQINAPGLEACQRLAVALDTHGTI